MKRIRRILIIAILLMAVLPCVCCRPLDSTGDTGELSVSVYIPDVASTKAETGTVRPLDAEKTFSSLQLWVFVGFGEKDGELVGYKNLGASELSGTGLPNSAITRFAIPLDREMFALLHNDDARVDIYAVANAASATSVSLDEETTRSQLEAITLSGATFGPSPLVTTVPSAGLPMAGMLKAATLTGDYPVLNVSTLTLTRAVSKLLFIFCQQGTPATDQAPAVPTNTNCVVKSISFDGTEGGHDCQIAASEKLFTHNTYGSTDNPFEISGYTPLATVLEHGASPLLANGDITVSSNPEELLFRSAGHVTESAQEYESRLYAALGTASQIGPIYIRETDKVISGTICYNAGEEDVTASFSMPADNVLCRNHSWILYAYFSETTRTLQFKIVVLPWDRSDFDVDYASETVNVIRRFTIPETNPPTFKKEQTENGYFDVTFWHTLEGQPNILKGDIIIATPVGQKLHIVPVPGTLGATFVPDLFTVTPMEQTIYPNYMNPENGRIEDCYIDFEIRCNPGAHTPAELEGNYIDLHFCVEIGDDVRWIDLDSESIDYYRVILRQDWNNKE